ncbi:hypothetical protein EAH81_25205 [Flavobacterium pectinovorum]|uniref:Uncharacterized protein n=1 Tax=Flavobacterium pectinovorum TaxID=29533 RepID=A0A502E6K6_9FLAO|nr:hypothetical protein EAH81_25205 [Flavobacterium pectinovorum]
MQCIKKYSMIQRFHADLKGFKQSLADNYKIKSARICLNLQNLREIFFFSRRFKKIKADIADNYKNKSA